MAMAGGIPSMLSTCGLSIRSKNCRAYGEKVSIYLRWPSANKVSKARELFPEPLKPVMTISCLSGRSRSKFFRLLWRTPFRRITDRADDFNIFKAEDKVAIGALQVVTSLYRQSVKPLPGACDWDRNRFYRAVTRHSLERLPNQVAQ